MNNIYIKYITLAPIYVLIQTLILDEILFAGYINPFLYIILIINLPIKVKKWFLLCYAFLLGITLDITNSTLGFHSTATVLISFLKPLISRFSIPNNTLGDLDIIDIKKIGIKAYLVYSTTLIIIHNICLFYIEYLSFDINMLIKTIISSFFTLIVVLITQLLIQKKK